MELRFWNDPETGLPHIYADGVTEEEVRQVLSQGLITLKDEMPVPMLAKHPSDAISKWSSYRIQAPIVPLS